MSAPIVVYTNAQIRGATPEEQATLDGAMSFSTDTGVFFVAKGGTAFPISQVENYEYTFAEASGSLTYTQTLAIPAGYSVENIKVGSTVVWTAGGGTATITVGDADSSTGYINAKNLKSGGDVPADTSGAWTYAASGAGGTYALGKYYAAAGLLTITVAKTGTGAEGRTRVKVILGRGAKTVTAVAGA